ncbi:dihydrodipicolinate synthase family protein [Oceanicella actignis]|uniref:4-hydroxy-tetrahydrodipicolinate synthase n=1 Tax=Oceanicella actignis TaxID=1189325 RepID=A0A1M7T895_9RHOB|nr:dihydrodipicolinate synthase family protein [Oceanicella actignis]SET49346.1 4-hydroxy-tetrahydrodipicolinate synthase [Oceanicella actignis]SHN66944.1 4-hydroxy-tetrahydrodipicolinate synthase [Oceanicella actignis]
MDTAVFKGVIPALMTPCKPDRTPDFDALVRKAIALMDAGMSGVVYCGSMGDWPLLTDEQRMEGVARLTAAGVPVVVGTGAVNTASAVALAAHAARVGAAGLMVIPRVLSRGASPAAQRNHFKAVLSAAPDLPAVIYNSPYYGFQTRADLFFALRAEHPNLVGFKEFGGPEAMTYAAEHITGADDGALLLAGVDTGVYHGYVRCGAAGTITGIGNALPHEVLRLVELCKAAAAGDARARRRAQELSEALAVLSSWDEGCDLVLYYKHLMTLQGDEEYRLNINPDDELTPSQRAWAERQFAQFKAWYAEWSAADAG